jgi:hypothetical protein
VVSQRFAAISSELGSLRGERTTGPSTSLRSGRDDKSVGGAFRLQTLVVKRAGGPSTSLRSGRATRIAKRLIGEKDRGSRGL